MLNFLVFAGLALAAAPSQYKIQTEVYIDGKLISNPSVVVSAGTVSSVQDISDDGRKYLKLNLLLENDAESDKTVKLDFKVDQSSGQKTIQVSPHMVVVLGEPAEVSMGTNATKDEIRLKVTATRL